MSIEKLPVFDDFPAEKGQSKIVLWIKNKIFAPISRRINWLLDRVLSEGFEIIPDGNEPGDNGNWRIIVSSGDWKVQKRVSDVWVDSYLTVDSDGDLTIGAGT
ncbi:hypothetical protein LCGC14_2970400, partial [marine sediment metagenome]